MPPDQSKHFLSACPKEADNSAKSEIESLAVEIAAMTDRVEACWQTVSQLPATMGTLAGLSSDVAASPKMRTRLRHLTSSLEDLRSGIGHVFASLRPH
jgi:hypothetical protein